MNEKYLPSTESQAYPEFDSFNCTNFSVQHLFETYLNEMIGEKTMTLDNIQWLNDNGYLDKYGSLDFSDQYNGILSGTKWGVGNYFEKVIESVLRDGLIPDKLFTDTPHSPEEYFDATLISQRMLNLGQEFLKRFEIKVVDKYAPINTLKTDLLWITINVGEGYGWKDPIPPSVMPPSHATLGYGIESDIVSFFDTYPLYRKRTAIQNVYAKWLISIKERKVMFKIVKTQNDEDVYFIRDGKRYQIGDYNTYISFKNILWGEIETISEEELRTYLKGGVMIITKSE